jgi:subtilisin family serine protease
VASGGRTPAQLQQALLADGRVAVAEPNHVGPVAAVPDDPHYTASQAAALTTIRLPEAWDLTTGADTLVLAVVDTGIRADHPDLVGRVLPGRDVVNGDDHPEDTVGHGTRAATVAAASADGTGMTGVAWRGRILPVKVDTAGYVFDADLAAGITWAADHGADVINLSVGQRPWSGAVDEAIRYARSRDAVLVAAAGNEGIDAGGFPAAAEGVIAVGAVDNHGHLASFSNYGPWVDLVAPGVDILTGLADGGYAPASGTSFAAPIVSGVALLARARYPHEKADQIGQRLNATARDVGPLGKDNYYGHGLVDALGAVGGAAPTRPHDARHVREPDNTAGQATPLTIGAPVRGILAPEGDADWWVVDVPDPQTLTFTVTPTGADASSAAAPAIDVVDSNLWPFPGQAVNPAQTTVALRRDVYYVRVRVPTPAALTFYELAVTPAAQPVASRETDLKRRVWISDTSPPAGSAGPDDVLPGIRVTYGNLSTYVNNAQMQLVDVSTGAVVPTDRYHDPATYWIWLDPKEPLVDGHVYEMRVSAYYDGSTWLPPDQCCFRFAVGTPPPRLDAPSGPGYWMLTAAGAVHGFGQAANYGAAGSAVDLEPNVSGAGYWIVNDRGAVTAFGDATWYGHADHSVLTAGERVTSLSATATGRGYWLFTDKGRVIPRGDAAFFGDMAAVRLNAPVLDSIPTPSGRGYYMVASDGGIFTFGDARFAGSMGGIRLNAPVQSLVPDADGGGYWLVASDGGVFSFDAPFRGSMAATRLNRPVTGMVPFGDGYLMVGEDGGIFNFSDRPFLGSLGANPPASPVVAVAAVPDLFAIWAR